MTPERRGAPLGQRGDRTTTTCDASSLTDMADGGQVGPARVVIARWVVVKLGFSVARSLTKKAIFMTSTLVQCLGW